MRCFTGLGLMSIGEGGPRLLPDLTYAEATKQYDIVQLLESWAKDVEKFMDGVQRIPGYREGGMGIRIRSFAGDLKVIWAL